ncbi:unnamed protein product [Ceratitis capitata]|uniref:(Mediterranean fruit fly) hypothetical protein n=1 Tax=Ceratitis capitata TaxID=7213 RepID=A0A811V1W8_CERCA|nr:unnamed protein product [Ceratitis capitata]
MPLTADTTTDINTTPNLQANTCNINTPSGDINNSGGFTNLSSLELIFLGYAKVLQRMPLRLQLQIKRKIADIMDEAELHLFEGNTLVTFLAEYTIAPQCVHWYYQYQILALEHHYSLKDVAYLGRRRNSAYI